MPRTSKYDSHLRSGQSPEDAFFAFACISYVTRAVSDGTSAPCHARTRMTKLYCDARMHACLMMHTRMAALWLDCVHHVYSSRGGLGTMACFHWQSVACRSYQHGGNKTRVQTTFLARVQDGIHRRRGGGRAAQGRLCQELGGGHAGWLCASARVRVSTLSAVPVCLRTHVGARGQPFDTVKVRLQSMPTPAPGQSPLYTGMVDCVKKTVQREGPSAFYKVPLYITYATRCVRP
jgi:hypothetical protein